jgi:hypothetical protein
MKTLENVIEVLEKTHEDGPLDDIIKDDLRTLQIELARGRKGLIRAYLSTVAGIVLVFAIIVIVLVVTP